MIEKVSFYAMADGTKADYEIAGRHDAEVRSKIASNVIG